MGRTWFMLCRRLARHARYSSRTEEREAGLNEQFENSRCSHSEYPDRRLRLKRALVKRLGVNTSLTVHNCPSNSDCLTNSYGVARRYTVWDSTSPVQPICINSYSGQFFLLHLQSLFPLTGSFLAGQFMAAISTSGSTRLTNKRR